MNVVAEKLRMSETDYLEWESRAKDKQLGTRQSQVFDVGGRQRQNDRFESG